MFRHRLQKLVPYFNKHVFLKEKSSKRPCISFLNKFTASENSLCMLFANDARRQLHNIFIQFGDNINIKTVRELRNAVLSKFFDLS